MARLVGLSKWAEEAVLENPLRRALQDPARLLEEMGATRGTVLMDIGCGYGFLSIPAAKLVGPKGLVYAVDNDDHKVTRLARKAEAMGLVNLRPIRSEAWRLDGVPQESVDVAVMLYSLHHFERVRDSLEEVMRRLRRGGKLFVYEPIRSRFAGHGTVADEVIEEGLRSGYRLGSLRKGILTYRLELVRP
ncbi:MAG: class I SAM-dependent methyltransferase [Candidatus Caldarchaeales archaeon]